MYDNYLQIEVSLSALAHNISAIRARLGANSRSDCLLCGVVKANAYGHGVAGLWPTLARDCDMLAAATIPEALRLREFGYSGELLTTIACSQRLWPQSEAIICEAIRADIQLMVIDEADLAAIESCSRSAGKAARLHVKVDTGMGRSGILADQAAKLIGHIRACDTRFLKLSGVCTHFAAADSPEKSHAECQLASFTQVLRESGLDCPAKDRPGILIHAAASAAMGELSASAFDMVRVGLAIYGYQCDGLIRPLKLRPSLRVVAPLVQVRKLPAGATCGYGCTRRLDRDSVIGIVPMGYADGLSRSLSDRMSVVVKDRMAAVLGRISMDQIIVDLTDIPQSHKGAMVEVISADPTKPNSVEALARIAGTIPYEITSALNPSRISYTHCVRANGDS